MSAKKETAQFYCDLDGIQKLGSEADSVNTANKQLQSDDEELLSENGERKKKIKVFRKIAKGMVKCLPHEKERAYGQSKTQKQKLKDENKDWKERWENSEKEKAQLKSAYDSEVLKSQIQQAHIDDLERERNELLYRLSKLAGDALTHDNSNIVNLSDVYRPSILSDTYGELYDNEWTDAFQELTEHGLGEKDAVEMLLKILLMCFQKCREITWERYQTLKHIMSNIDIVHIPRSAKNLPESEIRSNAKKLSLTYGSNSDVQNGEQTTVQHNMQLSNPDIGYNASNELEVMHSLGITLERLSKSEEAEIKDIAEIFPLIDGSASRNQNEEHTIVEHMMTVSRPENSNNASKELGIAYSIDKEVDRLSQHEATDFAGIVEIFQLSNGEHTMVEHITSVSNPENSNNESKELGIAYSIDKEVDRPSQHEATDFAGIVEIFQLCNGSASKVQNEENTMIEHKISVNNPENSNNASNELGIAYSIDKEVDRPSEHKANDFKGIDEISALSDGSSSKFENEEHKNVEHMMSVSNPENSNNASKELGIAYTIDKEVVRPLQHEAVNNPKNSNNASKELGIAYSIDKEVDRPSQHEAHFTSTIVLRIDQEKQIKDIWRTTTSALKNEAVKHLYNLLLTSFDIPIKDMEKTSKYLTSCIDLCWKMSVQEKPMYLDVVAEKDIDSEKVFDQDKFKAYTRSGERVDFVVWPALFLNEGGQIMFKGIAQGSQTSNK